MYIGEAYGPNTAHARQYIELSTITGEAAQAVKVSASWTASYTGLSALQETEAYTNARCTAAASRHTEQIWLLKRLNVHDIEFFLRRQLVLLHAGASVHGCIFT